MKEKRLKIMLYYVKYTDVQYCSNKSIFTFWLEEVIVSIKYIKNFLYLQPI